MTGKLHIVSTPIGNLKDITLRAIETLNEVDFILCEDTRVTSVLTKQYNIIKQLISFNAVSETKKIPMIIERLRNGQSYALVSDSGTPAISDPGIRLVSEAIKNGIEVISVPGATALIAALTISGLPTDSFVFEGFLPQKKGRQKKLDELTKEERTIVLYESSHRIDKLIDELVEYFPERYVVVCRELTKKFEETWRGYPPELKEKLNEKTIKGEFVIVIANKSWKH
ncbi:MAG: 16S rRNA (cytidine(1402)-2'-O)-methyltransferase [Ignavibacteriota bacterium]|jgi:16S rRNA (cytidine1402-2'-O)-methyltransferase|nr:MAG: 16S rRNA (cytidine(1402)-2'-O)-methyltransferase [Chlorobiota bacterium]MBE7477909.1 16S rRNA (cytidine(1402)-2'-O)-methyltransferase [Ignavibacteriales bacterium]MBL1123561.1 16S rRNA (cytidine(1402)-2'-O)-methyltransferase [Ignavibacteriota bacterium]MCE7856999.1 16S rRNA (cytidine(1402)-2'-O)-methyltransferase [Ignavibacteria bacterium CHB3]MCZ7612841.1 16S rRNA (cytidine(1402)-2'-O)-methyltransferase [Ignavibacteriaceae bacterium]MEB2296706.1 16S rRNA (cytidine(1402)-2'-O)-methyltr